MKTTLILSGLIQPEVLTRAALFGAMLLGTTLLSCRTNSLSPAANHYQLDEKTSLIEWRGSQPSGNAHTGTLAVSSEGLTVEQNQVTGGNFTLPLSSLIDTDLATPELKEQLIHHLQSADFFNMVSYPALSYTITGVVPYTGDEGNYLVSGTLTMLGQAHHLTFPARILLGEQLRVEARLTVDRTKWGMTYCADPNQAGDRYILPDLDIHLTLTATKS